MLLYAVTIFLGAFLLFQVQPMIAKAILPWFGGAAGVWAICLVFFQALLLGGYSYSHLVAGRLAPKRQAWLHMGLLWASLLVLPVAPSARWRPGGTTDPSFLILGLLAATIGLPYLLLSTAPLLQAWYTRSNASIVSDSIAAEPYRLFAVSNAGSLLGLLSYPLLFEPFLSMRRQMQVWSLTYAVFVALASVLAGRAARQGTLPSVSASERKEDLASPGVQALWLAFPACASTLLIAVTGHLTKDVAPIPFLWVLPLCAYLLSFILCFESETWYKRGVFMRVLLVAFAAMVCGLSGFGRAIGLKSLIAIFGGGLFVCCMVCHGELARLKPSAAHLTRFYITVAAGGALGGLFAGLLAPHIFNDDFELPIGLVLCLYLPALTFGLPRKRLALPLLGGVLAVILYNLIFNTAFRPESRLTVRNFYGVLHVQDSTGDPNRPTRRLRSGAINHGEQFLTAERRRQPTAYYSRQSGVGLAIQSKLIAPVRVGVIGLGAGVLASYGRVGDYYRFYEINPLVVHLAETQFTFLKDCPAQVDIALGDGRLLLEREQPQNFDVLVVDAFSGDAIPIHLLTHEAFLIYRRHLKRDGILAVHISNRYLDLAPMVQLEVRAIGLNSVVIENDDDALNVVFKAEWVMAGERPGVFDHSPLGAARPRPPAASQLRLWTDDYSNFISVIR